jgi:hypothetical protein
MIHAKAYFILRDNDIIDLIQTINLSILRDIVTIFGVAIGFSYYILNLRNGRETRQAQLFSQIHNQWNNKEFIKKFMEILNLWSWSNEDDFWDKYGQILNVDAYVSFITVLWYFEFVGVLLRRRLLDINLVDALYSDRYVQFWEKYESILQGLREDFKNPHYYRNSEYLYTRLKEHQQNF